MVACRGEEIGHTKEHLEGFFVPALQSGTEKVSQRQYLVWESEQGQARGLRERELEGEGAHDTAESLELFMTKHMVPCPIV